ncbi:MAG: ATP-binding protein [Corynebacterium sp.]|nr:ATP-binding protein [Corynebacterium sp.]
MLERQAYQDLLEWKTTVQGRRALLIEGARRVGKSTLATHFGRSEYRSVMVIDFFTATEEIKGYFRDYATKLDTLFMYLQAATGITLYERESLIIFDEVQAFPFARGLIKYLVADGRYDYIETGSLLSIRENVKDIVIPSEEQSYQLNPLTYTEFLWALGEKPLAELIETSFCELTPLPDGLHRTALRYFNEYLLIGGMPQAVEEYVTSHNLAEVDEIKRSILATYREDTGKYAGAVRARVVTLFDEIPGALSKGEKKITLTTLDPHARMRSWEDAFFWLSDARIANLCFASTDPHVGLGLNRETGAVKVYMADTGLLVTQAFSEGGAAISSVYRAVLAGDISLNKGMLTENAVAQMLVSSGHQLYYYSTYSRDNPQERMEIDFLITAGYDGAAGKPRVSPIEVKSTSRYRLSSLTKFTMEFSGRVGRRYVVHPKQLVVEGDLVYVPLYMGELL